ncbi:NADH-quinone oxidoreductase subunit I [candidate division KSB1 bacterium]|nr:NADH-quinone oxidoreductase subunit I [candidate division KSB1 bacterium]
MITVQPVRQIKLTLAQKTYYPELWKGLMVTCDHFFTNLFRHIGRSVGMKTKPPMVTIQYPEEQRWISPRWRGLHRLMLRPDGAPRCVACMMCETACPDKCIYITAGESPDGRIEKYPVAFEIDLLRCCFCGLCVEACPEDAIRMDTGIVEFGAFRRDELYLDREFLMNVKPELTTHTQYVGELDGRPLQRVDLVKLAQQSH